MALQSHPFNDAPETTITQAAPLDPPRRRGYCSPSVTSEMTTLDGLVTALRLVRWSDELVMWGTEAERLKAEDALEGLFAIVDATVAQVEKLSRIIHGESEEDEEGAA
jgi:hypothetical protein